MELHTLTTIGLNTRWPVQTGFTQIFALYVISRHRDITERINTRDYSQGFLPHTVGSDHETDVWKHIYILDFISVILVLKGILCINILLLSYVYYKNISDCYRNIQVCIFYHSMAHSMLFMSTELDSLMMAE
jgi:hypothetical protein